MKILFILAFLLPIIANGQNSAITVVQDQVAAYNKKDLDVFCSYYSTDIVYYDFENGAAKPFIEGPEQLRKNFETIFKNNPQIQCEVVDEITIGNKVIFKEKFTGIQTGKSFEVGFIYTVVDGKIKEVLRVKAK